MKKLKLFVTLTLINLMLISCSDDKSKKSNGDEADHKTEKNKELLALERDPRVIGPEKPEEQKAIEEALIKLDKFSENQLLGFWIGDFGNNKINLALFEVNDDKVSGYSICAGNYREIEGKVVNNNDEVISLVMDEPGDDPYDGTFTFDVNLKDMSIKGSWVPFVEKGNTAKNYTLEKKIFKYNPSVGDFPEASERILTEDEVANNYDIEELKIMRNEIYARHGYSFKNKEMRFLFNKKDWYMPMGVDIRGKLTDIEARNIDLIYRYEEYYEDTFDDFGR